jgi:hypothetical protein
MSTEIIKENYVLVAGFAQLPKGTSVFEMQKHIGCILLVDPETDTIKDATFTFLQGLTNQFIASLLVGKSLENTDGIILDIEKRFIVPPQKAVIQALLTAKKNYREKNFKF